MIDREWQVDHRGGGVGARLNVGSARHEMRRRDASTTHVSGGEETDQHEQLGGRGVSDENRRQAVHRRTPWGQFTSPSVRVPGRSHGFSTSGDLPADDQGDRRFLIQSERQPSLDLSPYYRAARRRLDGRSTVWAVIAPPIMIPAIGMIAAPVNVVTRLRENDHQHR